MEQGEYAALLSENRRLRFRTEHDPLTGLLNRSAFFSETGRILKENAQRRFVFVRFDIDRFHLINTFWGEEEGDRFLKRIALAVRKATRRFRRKTCGRISADIFCFCEPYEEEVLQRQMDRIRGMLTAFHRDYVVDPSFGIFVVGDPSLPVETIYERAALAAETCKRRHVLCSAVFDRRMEEKLSWERFVLREMKTALDGRQFTVYFQPKYNLRTNGPGGAEALVRWSHPGKGLLLPGRFVPVFEKNGFIGKLDFFVWERVCVLLRRWLDGGLAVSPVSVNVSRVNLYNPRLAGLVAGLVRKYGIPPSLLNLELTESAYMENPELMERTVRELHASGFLVCMDDFGSGYSSLNMLREIDVDVLKIDMRFLGGGEVGEAGGENRSSRILASVIRMAGGLNLPVVMEGVETERQVSFLRNAGCDYVQGFYFSPPVPPERYEVLLRQAGERG